MPTSIRTSTTISAAHFLPGYDGPCGNPHGHNWKITVTVTGKVHPTTGMVVDFGDLKAAIGLATRQLDHAELNKYLDNPTAENIAEYIAVQLDLWLDDREMDVEVTEIIVEETEGNEVIWRPSE